MGARPLMAITFFVKVQNENEFGLTLIEMMPWITQKLLNHTGLTDTKSLQTPYYNNHELTAGSRVPHAPLLFAQTLYSCMKYLEISVDPLFLTPMM